MHSKYIVYLGEETKFLGRPVDRVMELLQLLGVADIYLLPNLSLAVLKRGSSVPIDSHGLAGEYIGAFNEDVESQDLQNEINFAIEQVCPQPEVDDDDEPVVTRAVARTWLTMQSVVEHNGTLATIACHAELLGLPFKAVERRVHTTPCAPIAKLLRPLQHLGSGSSPHFAGRVLSRRAHFAARDAERRVAPLRQNRYDFAHAA